MMALKKETAGLAEPDRKKQDRSFGVQKIHNNRASHNPVMQRNRNRSKTNSLPT